MRDTLPRVSQPISDSTLQELLARYKSAYEEYQACVKRLSELTSAGQPIPKETIEGELKAIRALTQARAALLAALGELTDNFLLH